MRPNPPLRRAAARSAALCRLALVLGLAAGASPTGAQTPAVAPARATVYIRLVGDLEITRPADAFGPERRIDRSNVELSTGSGVLISPVGHVLTAAHVVTAESGPMTIGGARVDVKQTVRRLEVLLPPDEGGGRAAAPFEATILATDPALDLAVLSVNGSNLPFLDLGDSDALVVGDQVEAVGFPFGDQVEIGRATAELTSAPAPSVSRGNLAAFRGDGQGDRRYLQVTAPLNPGNSGGPVVDADGYLVAIANSVMRARSGVGAGVGFGVPVNLVKGFLELHAIDSALRGRRMAPGALSALEGKGLRVALPIGMSDTSPLRARVDTGAQPDGVVFRVDRVLSPWPLDRIEAALVSSRTFEPLASAGSPVSQVVEAPGGRLLVGRVTGLLATPAADAGLAPGDAPARIEYAIAERGGEKVIARFVGPSYQVAFNASAIRSALRQIEVDALRAPARAAAVPVAWVPRTLPRGTPLDRVPLPSGWVAEPVGPLACKGLPQPADAVSASPAGDFAVALRAGWISAGGIAPQAASAACGTPREGDAASYTREFTFLGARYLVEGRFAAVEGDGLLQMESMAPAEQASAIRAAFAAWPAK
jgi:S1-C subfamily serine protease